MRQANLMRRVRIAAEKPSLLSGVSRVAIAPSATLLMLSALLSLFVYAQFSLLMYSGLSTMETLVENAPVVLYFLTGLLAVWRQPHNPIGLLLIFTGSAQWCASLRGVPIPGFPILGTMATGLPLAILAHLVLAFPFGRLSDTLSRMAIAQGYVISVPFQALKYGFTVHGNHSAATTVTRVQICLSILGLAVVVFKLVQTSRTGGASSPWRIPKYFVLYGCVVLAILSVTVAARLGSFGSISSEIEVLRTLVLCSLPVMFLVRLLTGAFGRAGVLREYLLGLGTQTLDPKKLSESIATALGVREAKVVYSVDSPGHFVNADGSHAWPPRRPTSETLHPVMFGGRVVGGVLFDGIRDVDSLLLQVVSELSALTIDHQRVVAGLKAATAELEGSASALRSSHRRLALAYDAERRRIARDIHDGVQQRILTLGMQAKMLAGIAGSGSDISVTAEQLTDGLVRLLNELRELVHGIMPAPLVERGVVAAIELLADRIPVPLTMQVDGLGEGRMASELESTVYFVVLEAIANAVKHSHAKGINVRIARRSSELDVEIADDGIGGAALRDGTGLQGLRDRVDALAGNFSVTSQGGVGTLVKVTIPLRLVDI